MEKLYFKSTGEEVKLGDKLFEHDKSNGLLFIGMHILDETLRDKLLKEGVLVSKTVTEQAVPSASQKEACMNLSFYVDKLSKRLGWKFEKTNNFLDKLDSISTATVFSVLLREVAIELDKKYEDHITVSPRIYVISTMDGRITEVNKAHIKNYRNFAAFRSIEDAKIACKILSPILKYMFKSDRK